MRLSDRNPAIYAGLLGMGMWLDPVPALALQVPQAAEKLTVPWAQIGVGCLAGAAISGAVYLGVSLVSDHFDGLDEEDEFQGDELAEEFASEPASARIIPVDTEALQRQRASLFEELSAASLSAEVTEESQAVMPVSEMPEEPVVEAEMLAVEEELPVVEQPSEEKRVVRGRHMASAKLAAVAPIEGKVSPRHAARAKTVAEVNVPRVELPVPAASATSSKHARASLNALPMIEKETPHPASVPEVQAKSELVRKAPRFKNVAEVPAADLRPSKAPRFKTADVPEVSVKAPRFKTADVPEVSTRAPRFKTVEAEGQKEQKPSKAPRFKVVTSTERADEQPRSKSADVANDVAKGARVAAAAAVDSAKSQASDYADVAEKYVKKTTLAARVAARASGVANVLQARLKADMFDDLPIISRSDGTVGDVGTAWWDTAMGDSVRRVTDVTGEELAAEPVSIQSSQSLVAGSSLGRSQHIPAVPSASKTDGAKRSAYISKNVAEVRVGMYPEHRTAEELDQDDMWERALKAMGERIERENGTVPPPTPVFTDLVGDVNTLDEVDGLDGDTNFIPFKKPAGHPEVVDSSSYVDYLIDDEFSKNSSPVVRKSSANYLRVIRGGSQKSRPLPVQRLRSEYTPKHFANRGSSMALVGA